MGIFDNYVCEGQLSLFDMTEQPAKDVAEKYLEEVVLRGTGRKKGATT